MPLSNEYLLTLSLLKGVGTTTIEAIASYIESSISDSIPLKELYCALEEMLHKGLIRGTAKASFPNQHSFVKANETARRLLDESESMGIKMVSQYEQSFPKKLYSSVDGNGRASVPLFVFYNGDYSILRKRAIAIIGTRNPTPEGVAAGEYLASEFAKAGFNIVSGLAAGCDTIVHKGAISVKGGLTTAVLAHGLDTIYPPENTPLAARIVEEGGLLFSEYPIGTEVNTWRLVERDRLQAALADATIVVQTSIRGGTMNTVNATLAMGNPLYVVKYSRQILSDNVQGNKFLIENKNAKELTALSIHEIIDRLGNIHSEWEQCASSSNKTTFHKSPTQLEIDF